MVTLRRIVFVLFLLFFVLWAAVLAFSNPTPVPIDIGLMRFEQVSLSIAFAVAFAIGWAFGLVSAGIALVRAGAEKRRLRKELKYAEAELSSLRAPQAHDAN